MSRTLLSLPVRLLAVLVTATVTAAANEQSSQELFAPLAQTAEPILLQINNKSDEAATFQVTFSDSLGSPIRMEENTVEAGGIASLETPKTAATVRVSSLSSNKWSGRIRFSTGESVDLVSTTVPQSSCKLYLEERLGSKEWALVTIGTASGLIFSCGTSTRRNQGEEVPECEQLGLAPDKQSNNLSLSIATLFGDDRLYFYASIINEVGALVRIAVPTEATGGEQERELSCNTATAPARFPLLKPKYAVKSAKEALAEFSNGKKAISSRSAIERFKRALELDPASVCLRAQYISALRAAGMFDEVDVQISVLQQLAHDHPVTLHQIGVRRLEKGDATGAWAIFEKLVEKQPDSCAARTNLSVSLIHMGRAPSEVLTLWEGSPQRCGSGLITMAWCKSQQGDERQAHLLYREAVSVLKEEMRRELAAIDFTDISLFSSGGLVNSYLGLARAHRELGERDRSVLAIEAALRFAPAHVQANELAGHIAADAGRLDEALEHFNRFLGAGLDSATARLGRGFVFQQQGMQQNALGEYEKALQLNPSEAQVYINRGLIYLSNGDFEQAEKDFLEAKRLLPKSPIPVENLRAVAEYRKNGLPAAPTPTPPVGDVITSVEQAVTVARSSDHGPIPQLVDWVSRNQGQIVSMLEGERAAILDALFLMIRSQSKISAAASLLMFLAGSSDHEISTAAIAAIRSQHDSAALPVLIEIAAGRASGCRACALECLSVLETPKDEVIRLVEPILKQPHLGTLKEAILLLGSAACKDPTVLKHFSEFTDPAARAAVDQAGASAFEAGCQ